MIYFLMIIDSKLALQNNILFYIKNQIEIDMFYNKENNNLTIGNDNYSKFYIESIMNIQQFKSFINYFISQKEKDNIYILKNDKKKLIIKNKIYMKKTKIIKNKK